MNNINYQKKMEEIIKNIQKENTKPKLLLHACCGPCSTQVLEELKNYFNIDIFYYNPNIYPADEFYKRSEVVKELVKEMGLNSKVYVEENNPKEFYDYVNTRKDDHEGGKSCFKCYKLRLKKTALKAKEENYDFFTTTLSISPFKNAKWLNEIGKSLEEEYKVKYLYSDFKKKDGYKKSIDFSRKYNLYRQDYCGCIFSFKERNLEKPD